MCAVMNTANTGSIGSAAKIVVNRFDASVFRAGGVSQNKPQSGLVATRQS